MQSIKAFSGAFSAGDLQPWFQTLSVNLTDIGKRKKQSLEDNNSYEALQNNNEEIKNTKMKKQIQLQL